MITQLIVNGLVASATIALVSLGLTLIFSVTRMFHLAHAITITVTAYLAFLLIIKLGLPTIVGLLMGVVGATAVAAGIDFCVYRPLRRLRASSHVLLIASLGVVIVGQNCVSLVFGEDTKALRSADVTVGHLFLGARITNLQILTVVLAGAICASVILVLRQTAIGQSFRAMASDPELAEIVGIRIERVILAAFLLASAIAGIAGLLLAYDFDLNPTMGFNPVLLGLTATVIGGPQSLRGSLIGALLVGISQNFAGWILSTQWQDAIAFVILIMFLIVKPKGLLNRAKKAAI